MKCLKAKTWQKILSILALLMAGITVIASISEFFSTGIAMLRSYEWGILFLSLAVVIGLFSKKK